MKKVSNYPTEKEIEERRLAAVPYLENHTPHKEIASRFAVSRRTVRSWSTRLRRTGVEGMKVSTPFHRPLKLPLEQRTELASLLLEGAVAAGFDNELWTAKRVQELVDRKFGVHYNVTYLPMILHELGFTPQKPEEKAVERDEERIRSWVHKDWRDLKKKPEERDRK